MAYANIVGRKLGVPIVNLGFSGNGQSEPELADLLAEIDAAVYVLDALWNMSPEMVRDPIAPFVRRLRAARPDTPILLAQDCTIRGIVPTAKGKLLRAIHAQLQQDGVAGLYFLSAEGMMGPDGAYPTDLGFMHQAEVFAAALRQVLSGGEEAR